MEAVGIAKTLGEGAGQVQALKDVHLSLNGGELALLGQEELGISVLEAGLRVARHSLRVATVASDGYLAIG